MLAFTSLQAIVFGYQEDPLCRTLCASAGPVPSLAILARFSDNLI
jgi:hypothetical protein